MFGDMHEHFMKMALEEAEAARAEDEVPVGAVIVFEDRVIARAHNQRESLHDPTAHAEMIAITQAADAKRSWRLDGCTLYVTLEPCPMCTGALVHARVARLVYGAPDPRTGSAGSVFNLACAEPLNHCMEVTSNVLGEACSLQLKEFFRRRRKTAGNPQGDSQVAGDNE